MNSMTFRQAILKSLTDVKRPLTASQVYDHIINNNYYQNSKGKSPDRTTASWLGFLAKEEKYKADGVERQKNKKGVFEYYLTSYNDATILTPTPQTAIPFYIQQYKKDFDRINALEIYKWKAVKCFQDNWNVDQIDFEMMLESAFEKTKSLLDSGNYFPLRMLIKNTAVTPDAVKQLFTNLYNENLDLKERVEGFITNFRQLNENNFPGKNAYQDHRSVLVYLCMRYPEDYFLYKFTMFTQFAKLIDYHYTPKRGKTENIFQYLHLCEQVKSLVETDETLQRLHKQRIVNHSNAYAGDSTNLLVQDIIYAATFHFKEVVQEVTPVNSDIALIIEDTEVEVVVKEKPKTTFKGSTINHTVKQKKNKRIGNAGEIFILKQENKRLLPLKKEAEHVALTQGDGLGYDIKSYDDDGNEIYIEVKTTTQKFGTPFFITRTELARSRVEGDRYRLYRVYDFDMVTGFGAIHITKGSLEQYCVEVENYRVLLRRVGGGKTTTSDI